MKEFGAVICKYKTGSKLLDKVLKVDARFENRHTWTDDLAQASIFDNNRQAEDFVFHFVPKDEGVIVKGIRIV